MGRRKRHFGQILPGKRKGTFRVRWREHGKVRQKSIAGSKDLAARFLAKKQTTLAEEEALGHGTVQPIRFETLLDRYEELFAGEKEPPTIVREAQQMRSKMLPYFRGMAMDKVRRADIERFLIQRTAQDKLSGSTRNKQLNMLSSFFQKAVDLGHARENPCRGIRRQQEPLKPVPFVTVAEQEKLVAATEGPLRHLVSLLLDTGLRLGEALKLERRDVDLKRRTATVRTSKNKTGREVPFTSRGFLALQTAIRAKPEHGLPRLRDYVFSELQYRALTGEVLLKRYQRRTWAAATKAVGLPHLRLHDLRHIWAVTCVRAGISLQELRELGGWKSLHMVLRYSRHVPDNTPDLARARLESFLQTREDGHASGHGSDAKASGS